MLIAIDGPTASGKGTIARRLGERYGLPVLDTGLLYRAVAHAVLRAGADPADPGRAEAAARALDPGRLDDPALRGADVGAAASVVAAHPGVRAALLAYQRAFASHPGGAVLDGRDIATVIAPQADVKLFVTASVAERARRRRAELLSRGEDVPPAAMIEQIEARDARDSGRADAPLAMAADAILLDTTQMPIEAAVAEACAIIDRARAAGR
jgi:cytidylate kinase